ncbi:hypothetical protein ACEQPO_02655 [Bacillus sp. SL00103]
MFERHRERMQTTYRNRSKQLVTCLKSDQIAYQLGEEEPATHTHVRPDRSILMNQLIQRSRKRHLFPFSQLTAITCRPIKKTPFFN